MTLNERQEADLRESMGLKAKFGPGSLPSTLLSKIETPLNSSQIQIGMQ